MYGSTLYVRPIGRPSLAIFRPIAETCVLKHGGLGETASGPRPLGTGSKMDAYLTSSDKGMCNTVVGEGSI